MAYSYRGDPHSIRPWGICAKSNFRVPHDELVKQMEFRGNGLVWTGNWVWYKFADQPNPQGLAPRLRPDPDFVVNPRPDFNTTFNITASGFDLTDEDGNLLNWT